MIGAIPPSPLQAAAQADALERMYLRLFSRKDAQATSARATPDEPVDTYEPASARETLPTVTYSLRPGSS